MRKRVTWEQIFEANGQKKEWEDRMEAQLTERITAQAEERTAAEQEQYRRETERLRQEIERLRANPSLREQ